MNPLGEWAEELCRVFLGWRLREDYDALLALEEGSLEIDLLSGEAWWDGDPLPPLFIAGVLRALLLDLLEKRGQELVAEDSARLEVEFATSRRRSMGPAGAHLDLACRAVLSIRGVHGEAQARSGEPGAAD